MVVLCAQASVEDLVILVETPVLVIPTAMMSWVLAPVLMVIPMPLVVMFILVLLAAPVPLVVAAVLGPHADPALLVAVVAQVSLAVEVFHLVWSWAKLCLLARPPFCRFLGLEGKKRAPLKG